MGNVDLPRTEAIDGIDPDKVPVHIACVMDGNGRWAAERDLPRTEGHRAGEKALSEVVKAAMQAGVKWLTAYAFSTENWSRPSDEVEFLMAFNEDVLEHRSTELHEQGVRLIFAGRHGFPVPPSLAHKMDQAMDLTKNNDKLTLVVAFNYGGRAEIVDAIRALVQAGTAMESIDENAVRSQLYVPDMPDVDVMIRTSNELRISNFLLWQVAYAELIFTETLWPDFGREQLFAAIREYQGRKRRFGGLSDDESV